jgi:four helix bundle protein
VGSVRREAMSAVQDTPEDLRTRTKRFALSIIRLVGSLPRDMAVQEIGRQLLRSGTSVAANCRASRRGRSTAEFIAKLGIVEEEADESCLWLELLSDAGLAPQEQLAPLLEEANEIVAIVVASLRTAKRNRK